MNMGKVFYLGVALCVVGIVLMSLPQKPCEDCEDDIQNDSVAEADSTHIYSDDEVTGD
jgi:hypothetical protein